MQLTYVKINSLALEFGRYTETTIQIDILCLDMDLYTSTVISEHERPIENWNWKYKT